jgi:hypothetical protein
MPGSPQWSLPSGFPTKTLFSRYHIPQLFKRPLCNFCKVPAGSFCLKLSGCLTCLVMCHLQHAVNISGTFKLSSSSTWIHDTLLTLIHTYHAIPMPHPCRATKGLDCLSLLIYTVRPSLIHTWHATPVPCHDHAVLKATSQGLGTARHGHGMCESASAVQRRHVSDLPTFGFFWLPRGVPRRLLPEAYRSVKM